MRDDEHEIEAFAAREAAHYLSSLDPDSRGRAMSASFYACAVVHALRRSSRRPADWRAFVRREVRHQVLADVIDPAAPLSHPKVLDLAVELATTIVERQAARAVRRHGNGVVEAGSAPGYAFDALVAWGKAETGE